MAEILQSVSNALIFVQEADQVVEVPLRAYGSVEGADTFFASKLRRQIWQSAELQDKKAALTEATEWIDRLSYKDCKTDPDQLFQFPRGGDTVVPTDVEKACYEIAEKLLDGMDPELEIKNLGNTSQGFGGARTTYDRAFVLEHLAAGIVSSKAWTLLKPFLNDSRALKLSRVE